MTELVVTMGLMAIVGGALSAVIASATKAEVHTNLSYQAQVQGRLALDKLRRELHCAASVSVVNSTGTQLSAGAFGQGANVIMGGYCPTNGLTTNAGSVVYVTWCTRPSTGTTGDYALYRLSSLSTQPACGTSGGTKWADYLTTSSPFCKPSTTAACMGVYRSTTSLQTLRVSLPVNLNGPNSTTDTFNLYDDIALRNSLRS
jgi:hypothetical protein